MTKKILFVSLILIAALVSKAQTISDRLNRINSYTKNSDPYHRFFTYNQSTGELKWVTGDGTITCSGKLSAMNVVKESSSGSSCYVSFKSKDGSQSIACNYTGNTASTSVSMNSCNDADAIVREILAIANSGGNSNSDLLARVNEICNSYDDAQRVFTYNESTGILQWINKKGDITCTAPLNKLTITSKKSGSYTSISFDCTDGTTCITCTYYSAPVASTAISIERSESMAQEVLDKLNQFKSSKTGGSNNKTLVTNVPFVPQPQHQ